MLIRQQRCGPANEPGPEYAAGTAVTGPACLPCPASPAGFSNLDGENLHSERTIFILGFGLYCGLSVPAYFEQYAIENGHGPVNTGSTEFNNIMNSLFSTPAAVSLMATVLLDLTIPVPRSERAHKKAWQRQQR